MVLPRQRYLSEDAGRINNNCVFGNLTFKDDKTRVMKVFSLNAARLHCVSVKSFQRKNDWQRTEDVTLRLGFHFVFSCHFHMVHVQTATF